MNHTTIRVSLLTLLGGLLCQAQPGNSGDDAGFREIPQKKPVFRDVTNHAQLAEMSRRAVDPMKQMKILEGDDPAKENKPINLLEQSDILCFNGLATLVPKRAIISSPKKYENRYKFVDGSQVVSYQDFFAQNRGWITNIEVSRAQAEGVEGFDEKLTEFIQESSNLIVATYLGGPISVLPPKEPENAEGAEGAEGTETGEKAKPENKPKIR